MTDKVQKILDEITVRKLCAMDEHMAFYNDKAKEEHRLFSEIEEVIKTLQKEPVSVWHDMSEKPKPNMELICIGQYGSPLVLSSNSNSFKERDISNWAYFSDLLNLPNVQRAGKGWKEEPVSKDLEKAAVEAFKQIVDTDKNNFLEIFKAGAKWKEQQIKKEAIDGICISNGAECGSSITSDAGMLFLQHNTFNVDDKVKVIIIKSE